MSYTRYTCEDCAVRFLNGRAGTDPERTLCTSCAAKTFGDSFECRECGNHDRAAFWIQPYGAQLAERKLCHTCNHWHEKLAWKAQGDPNQVIVAGVHYHISPDDETSLKQLGGWGSGFGGSKFKVRFHDGREVVSRNLWCQGDVPERFRERLPDNAVFVTETP